MTRTSVFMEIVFRYTSGVLLAGALLGAVYGFVGSVLDPIPFTITTVDPRSNPGNLVLLVLGVICFGLIFALFGGLIGAVLGLLAGVVTGLLLGLLTIVAFYPQTETRLYRVVTGLLSALITTGTTLFVVNHIFPVLSGSTLIERSSSDFLTFLLSPVPISGFGAWWVSRNVARWYQRELTAQQAQEASPSSPTLL